MYENQNEHCAINVFSECNVRNVIFRFFFTRLGKGRGNSNWFPFGHVLLITETSQTICNHILNIDQLEMKYMLVSGKSIRVGSHVVFAWIHCTDVRIHCTDILIECR